MNDTCTHPFMYFTLEDFRIPSIMERIRSLVWKKSFLLKRYSLFCCLIDIKYKWKAAYLFLLPVLNVKGTVLFISFLWLSPLICTKKSFLENGAGVICTVILWVGRNWCSACCGCMCEGNHNLFWSACLLSLLFFHLIAAFTVSS